MAAAYAGIAAGRGASSTPTSRPAELIEANPLGKIPVLLTDDGEAIFDSRAITQYLNRMSGSALFPRNAGQAHRGRAARGAGRRHLRLPAGACLRAPRRGRRRWCTSPGSTSSGARSCARSTTSTPTRRSCGKKPTAGHIALRAALGYLDLRFAGKWEKGRGQAEALGGALRRKIPGAESACCRPDRAAKKSRARGPAFLLQRHRVLDQNFMPRPKVTRLSLSIDIAGRCRC